MIARVPQLNWLVAAGLPESLIASQSCASRQSLDRTGLPPRHVVWGLSGLFRWAAVRGAFLSLFTLSVVAQTQCSVTLAWDPSPGDSIVGYNLYYGSASRTYTNIDQVGDVTQVTVTNLCPGATYYFAITSVDASGAESDYSAELIYTVPRALATLQLRVTPTGQAILDATGLAGQSYDILAAPSLGSWTNLGTLTLGADGTSEFIDSTAAGQPSCFYRLRGK
jgi:hypothetical protein